MSTARDFTKAEFKAACKRHGFKPSGIWGYHSMPGTKVEISIWNAGDRRRTQLAYLIQEQRRLIEKAEKAEETPA